MINSLIQNIDKEVDAVKEKEKTLTELRMLKHEIRDLYIPLREMMNDGQYDEAIQKISETINDAEDNFDTMFIFDTGSASVNAVINYYLRSMFRNGIKVKQNITKMSLSKEDEEALCLVLINMLKNAYENLLQSGEKEAYLFFGKDKGYIKVIVANRIRNSILEKNAGLLTSKEDKNNHGYGTRIIKRMAEKRKGEAHFYEENGFFTVEVWLEKA